MCPQRGSRKILTADDTFDDSHTITLGNGATNSSGRVLHPGDTVGGTYKLKSLLGRGGMGYVFCAEHTIINHDYALKLLAPEMLNQSSRRRFEMEGKAIANLDHVSIVKVYNMGIDEGDCPYYVMDLLEGISFADCIQSSGGIALDDCLDIFTQIAAGLAYAHSKGIIHRDVKPSNIILLPRTGGGWQVKIVDFGIAKLLDSASLQVQAQTAVGEIFGSPFYMSPEQCLGEGIDVRSDIYSLGCTLFEALCGEPPYCGQSALETMMMHQISVVPSLLLRRPEKNLPPAVDDLAQKMMAKRPSDRYQSMSQLLHDLERLKAGKPIGKYADGTAYDARQKSTGSAALPYRQSTESIRGAGSAADDYAEPARSGARLWPALGITFGIVLTVGALCFFLLQVKRGPVTAAGANLPAVALTSAPKESPVVTARDNYEHSPTPADLPDLEMEEHRKLISAATIEKARQVFNTCPAIISRPIYQNGMRQRMFSFPSVALGYLSGAGHSEILAVGNIICNDMRDAQLRIKACDTASFYLPEVLEKVGGDEFVGVLLNGLGPDYHDPAQEKLESGNIDRIMTIVYPWKRLQNVAFTACIIDKSMLDQLNNIRELNHLEIHKCLFADNALSKAPFWHRLEQLCLDRLTDADTILIYVNDSPRLKKLKLDELHVSPAALEKLNGCPNLRNLTLSKNVIDEPTVEALTKIASLKEVHVEHAPLQKAALQILVDCPHIKVIYLDEDALNAKEKEQCHTIVSSKIIWILPNRKNGLLINPIED